MENVELMYMVIYSEYVTNDVVNCCIYCDWAVTVLQDIV